MVVLIAFEVEEHVEVIPKQLGKVRSIPHWEQKEKLVLEDRLHMKELQREMMHWRNHCAFSTMMQLWVWEMRGAVRELCSER